MSTARTLTAALSALAAFAMGPALADRADNNSRIIRSTGELPQDSNAPQFNFTGRDAPTDDAGFFSFFFGNMSQRAPGQIDINIEPEIDTSSDVPIYTYYADPLVALGRTDLKPPPAPAGSAFSLRQENGETSMVARAGPTRADDGLARTVFAHLKGLSTGVRVTQAQNKAIVDFYEKRGFAPLWTSRGGLEPKSREVLALLAAADEEGLTAADYLPPALSGFQGEPVAAEGELDALANLEVGLTAMALRYAMHASGGRIVPNRLSGYHDLEPPTVSPSRTLAALAEAPKPADYLAGLHPSHPAYAAFKAALKTFAEEPVEAEVALPIENGPLIRAGNSDTRVPAIRARLAALGHYVAAEAAPASDERMGVTFTSSEGIVATVVEEADSTTGPAPSDPTVYDAALREAVVAFQETSNLKPDGVIGERTIAALNGDASTTSKATQAEKIRLAMERLRWLPRDFGRRHVFANQAAFELYVLEDGRQVWQTKVIVGKPKNQTAFFVDELETVVFNPYWGVPQSIIVKEMLPYLRQDPSYLDRQGFEVTDLNGRHISSSAIDWSQFGSKVPLNVRQPPGSDNALGEVKFLFPNSHSIYMHDTPSKPLFSKPVRAFSHGCVRVENPRRFAQILLGWPAEEVAAMIERRDNREVDLPSKVPVYLAYFTAWPDASGQVRFYDDIYGRDQLMETALSTTALALR
jgi:murein L,D-transpeptidase YcbB/YkuD